MIRWCTFMWIGSLLLAASVCGSATPMHSANPDSILLAADSLRHAGNMDAAEAAYRTAIDQNDSSKPAWEGLGMLYLENQNWGDAVDCYDHLMTLFPSDLAPHLALGMAYRERGTTKASLLRTVDWNKSRDQFDAILARDSSFRDALYQYALLEEYRGEYITAIAMGHRQIEKQPGMQSPRLGLFRLYRHFIAEDRPAAIAWLGQQQSAIARYFLGEALRRDGRLDDAERMFLDMLYETRTPLSQPLCLSLARIAAKRGLPAVAEAYIVRAIDELVSPLGADLLFEDIKYIISDRELALYNSRTSVEQKAQFFRAFWASRNPSGNVGNPRVPEHYRRLVRAEDDFEYTGFRTGFTDPDRMKYLTFPRCYALNKEFNDMGLIYIRHGEPDNRLRGNITSTDPQESWLYEATGEMPRQIFHFAKFNAPGNNWRLTALPNDQPLIANLTVWDTRYSNLLGDNSSASLKMLDELTSESGSTVLEALSTDNHTWEKTTKPMVIPHAVDAFRSAGSRALVDISCAIPLDQLRAEVAPDTRIVYAEAGIAIRSLTSKTVVTFTDTIRIPLAGSSGGHYVHLFRYRIPPDAYSVSQHIRPIGTSLYGSWNVQKTIPVFSPTEPGMSDIQFLMPAQSKSDLEFDGIKVAPSPFSYHPQDTPLYSYVHIYNLRKDGEGKSAYEARYVLAPAGKPSEATVVAQSLEVTAEDIAAEFKKISLSDTDPGKYVLTIEVMDRRSKQTTRASRTVQVFEP
jgi:GWxTD domain-containing protein